MLCHLWNRFATRLLPSVKQTKILARLRSERCQRQTLDVGYQPPSAKSRHPVATEAISALPIYLGHSVGADQDQIAIFALIWRTTRQCVKNHRF